MKLSQDRQQYVESLLAGKLLKLSPKYQGDLERLNADFWMPKSDRIREILKVHTEHIQELADFTIAAYLNAYRDESQMPDDNEIVEITNKLSYWLNKEVADAVLHLRMDLALSGETTSIVSNARSSADKELRNARTAVELERKRKEETRMNQKLILEKEEKRYRVLKRIYVEAGGRPKIEVSQDTIHSTEELGHEEIGETLEYLEKEGLIQFFRLRTVVMTHLGVKEIEDSLKHPNRDTDHFQSQIIQHFYGPVQNLQTGNQNIQNVVVNINPDFNEAVSNLLELIRSSTLEELKKDDAIEALERVTKLAQKEKTPDVIEAATKRLTLLKTAFEVVKLSAQAAPYLQYLYHWFQG
jgi:hypothetical protein